MTGTHWGILGGLVLIAVLLVVIVWQWRRLQRLNQQTEARRQKAETDQAERRRYLIESMQVIARTMLAEQVDLSEGCIRIKVLMDNLDSDLQSQEKFRVFSVMYEATQHMPTHEARQAADRNLIEKLDEERFALEKQHREAIRAASNALLEHFSGQSLH